MVRVKFVILVLGFLLVFVCFSQVPKVKAESLIYIRADGTIEGTDKIQRVGNVYSLIDDLSCSIEGMDVFIAKPEKAIVDSILFRRISVSEI